MEETHVSKSALIREMDADDLAEYGQELYIKENSCGLSLGERSMLEDVKKNYKHLTGKELNLKTRIS